MRSSDADQTNSESYNDSRRASGSSSCSGGGPKKSKIEHHRDYFRISKVSRESGRIGVCFFLHFFVADCHRCVVLRDASEEFFLTLIHFMPSGNHLG